MDVSLRERGVFAFGPFRLDPTRRTLRRDGHEVTLTARLFDTLLYLVQNPDRLVTRDELQNAVWDGRVVEDGNLQKAISALRKALQAEGGADTMIVTVPGRGFRFAVPVAFEPELVAAAQLHSFGSGDDVAPLAPARPPRLWWGPAAVGTALVAVAVAVVGISVWHYTDRQAVFAPPPHSVAVLAFTNLSGEPSQEYFSDGLSEELIDSLGHISALRVAARASSFSFKGKPATIGDIARQLNVGAVLDGSVRRDGAKVRITAQLIDARSGYQIWSQHFDSDAGDVLKVQTAIASAVTTAMQVTMVGDDAAQFSLGGTANPQAFDAYLRGMKLHNEGTQQSVRQARIAFEAALALDPNYALAHVRHISCLILTAQRLADPQPDDPGQAALLAQALAEAEHVVVLAPNLGAAHTILGNALFMTGNFVRADAEQRRALALAPGDPWVNTMYGLIQSMMGHGVEASESAQLATELDPLSAEAFFNQAQVLVSVRRPADALAALQRAKQLGSASAASAYLTFMAELEEGNAAAAARDCSAGEGNPFCLAVAYHALGRQDDADAQLSKLRGMAGDDGANDYARIYAQWGRTDDALKWLETAYARHELTQERSDWMLDPIRDTPRFREIERRMNFPP